MGTFILPDLGEGLPDATIRKWYVNVGDTVKMDQPLVAVETAKAVVDIPAAFTGKITALKGNASDTINVGDAIIEYEEASDGNISKPTADTDTTAQSAEKKSSAQTVVGNLQTEETVTQENAMGIQAHKSTITDVIKAVPAARLIAREFNIDLKTITPTGENNIITVNDVKKAITPQQSSSMAKTTSTCDKNKLTPLTQAQRELANLMAKSHQEITPATLIEEADLHTWSKNEDITVRLTQAIVAALKAEPLLNAFYYHEQRAYQLNPIINIGIAVDAANGLYLPVIKDAGALTSEKLREQINLFKQKATNQTFSSTDLTGANIMLSNYGSIVGRYATPTLIPPIVTIVGAGKIYRKAVPVDDQKIEIHRILPLSITIDHRLITGRQVAHFLQILIQTLEKN